MKFNLRTTMHLAIMWLPMIFSNYINAMPISPGQTADTGRIDNTITESNLLYADDFSSGNGNWRAEFEKPKTSNLLIKDGHLDVSSSAGATIWFNKELSGNIAITYNAVVIDSGNVNDRVSDLNSFWMALDTATGKMPVRNGKFSSYDNINLYYAGIGGHDNSTTRFRKYNNEGCKSVISEYLDKAHLLEGNKMYTIKIIVAGGHISFYLNKELYFDYVDSSPYRHGYFGFRTTASHQRYSNFKIYRMREEAE